MSYNIKLEHSSHVYYVLNLLWSNLYIRGPTNSLNESDTSSSCLVYIPPYKKKVSLNSSWLEKIKNGKQN